MLRDPSQTAILRKHAIALASAAGGGGAAASGKVDGKGMASGGKAGATGTADDNSEDEAVRARVELAEGQVEMAAAMLALDDALAAKDAAQAKLAAQRVRACQQADPSHAVKKLSAEAPPEEVAAALRGAAKAARASLHTALDRMRAERMLDEILRDPIRGGGFRRHLAGLAAATASSSGGVARGGTGATTAAGAGGPKSAGGSVGSKLGGAAAAKDDKAHAVAQAVAAAELQYDLAEAMLAWDDALTSKDSGDARGGKAAQKAAASRLRACLDGEPRLLTAPPKADASAEDIAASLRDAANSARDALLSALAQIGNQLDLDAALRSDPASLKRHASEEALGAGGDEKGRKARAAAAERNVDLAAATLAFAAALRRARRGPPGGGAAGGDHAKAVKAAADQVRACHKADPILSVKKLSADASPAQVADALRDAAAKARKALLPALGVFMAEASYKAAAAGSTKAQGAGAAGGRRQRGADGGGSSGEGGAADGVGGVGGGDGAMSQVALLEQQAEEMERIAQEQKAAAEKALAAAKTKEAKEKAQALMQAAEVALWDAEVARQAVEREKGHREELRAAEEELIAAASEAEPTVVILTVILHNDVDPESSDARVTLGYSEQGSGLTFSERNAISSLRKGGLAAREGLLHVGDTVLAVDGRPLHGDRVAAAMNARRRRQYALRIARQAGTGAGGATKVRGEHEGWLHFVRAKDGERLSYLEWPRKVWAVLTRAAPSASTHRSAPSSRCARSASRGAVKLPVTKLRGESSPAARDQVLCRSSSRLHTGVERGRGRSRRRPRRHHVGRSFGWTKALRKALEAIRALQPTSGWLIKQGGRDRHGSVPCLRATSADGLCSPSRSSAPTGSQ